MSLKEQAVVDALSKVKDPEIGRSLVSLGMIKNLKVEGNKVSLDVELTTPACPLKNKIEEDVRQALKEIDAEVVDLKMTSKVVKSRGTEGELLANIKNIILVASGKGGVGKSTVAANLALALSQTGASVGLLDADIYGPSIPILMGLDSKEHHPETVIVNGQKCIVPFKAHGLEVMSIGFFVSADSAMIWRGPMIHGALMQFMEEVAWSDLDYMVLDLPPGTGDVQLSLSQKVSVTGAIIVTTPQLLSLADVIRAKAFFEKLEIPMLGVVENMSYFLCPTCNSKHYIFDKGGGSQAADRFGLPLLAELPLYPSLREASDNGIPEVIANPEGPVAQAFKHLAEEVASTISMKVLA